MSASFNTHSEALKAPITLTIDAGVVTVTQKLHIIKAESGTTDDLDTISLGYDNLSLDSVDYYPVLYVQAYTGHTITAKHGVDNLDLPADTDIDIVDDSWQVFIWNGTNWQTFVATAL
jgi:hypothetical protein